MSIEYRGIGIVCGKSSMTGCSSPDPAGQFRVYMLDVASVPPIAVRFDLDATGLSWLDSHADPSGQWTLYKVGRHNTWTVSPMVRVVIQSMDTLRHHNVPLGVVHVIYSQGPINTGMFTFVCSGVPHGGTSD
jgi:hypothetical protein